MITNTQNLPTPLVNAIKNDPYDRGLSDISVTQLIGPPQIRKLTLGREIVEDASDCIWRLIGSAVHAILERADPGTAIVEQRLYTEVLGWIVSGAFDVYNNARLSDYKITSVLAYGKTKPEWTNQLNLLAALLRRNNKPVTDLEVVAIWRDWRSREATYDANYPQAQVSVVPIPLWTEAEAEAYLHERVRLHQLDTPPPCTDEERWHQPDKFALMKKGNKRAVKLYDAMPDFENDISRNDPKLYWEHRVGEYIRCERFCAVAHVCPQLKAEVPF